MQLANYHHPRSTTDAVDARKQEKDTLDGR